MVAAGGVFFLALVAVVVGGTARLMGRRIPFVDAVARSVINAERASIYPLGLRGEGDWTVGDTRDEEERSRS